MATTGKLSILGVEPRCFANRHAVREYSLGGSTTDGRVLSYTDAENLFQKYLRSLEGTPLMTPTAVARLAASKSLLSRILIDPDNGIVGGTFTQTVQEAISIVTVVDCLFSDPEKVETGIYDEWQESLRALIDHEKAKHNQPALSVLVNAATEHGIRWLLWTAKTGNEAIIATMVGFYNDRLGLEGEEDRARFVNLFESWGGRQRRSLLWWVLESDSAKLLNFALAVHETNPRTRNGNFFYALIWAVRSGKIIYLHHLLDLEEVSPNIQDHDGRSPLLWAADTGHEHIVKLLVDSGKADVDLADHQGQTPLSWAAGSGHAHIAQALLQNPHINPNSTDSSSLGPLMWAAANDQQFIVEELLRINDVDLNPTNVSDRTAISHAAEYASIEVMRLLLSRAGPNIKDDEWWTPLMQAERGSVALAGELLIKVRGKSILLGAARMVGLQGNAPSFMATMQWFNCWMSTLLQSR